MARAGIHNTLGPGFRRDDAALEDALLTASLVNPRFVIWESGKTACAAAEISLP